MSEEQGATIEVVTDVSEADYRRVLYVVRKKTISLLGWLTLTLFVLTFIFSFVGIKWGFPDAAGGYVLFALILALILAGWVFVEALLKLRSDTKYLAGINEPTTILFTGSGIQATAETGSSVSSWTRFEKVQETETDVLFFPQRGYFFPVPKRFFESEDQIERLKVLLRAHVGDKAKLKS